jgi:NADH-quinone oxidoreductase subunit L
MAIALILLAVGSITAGFIGIPHALGGHNVLGVWLEPSFGAPASTSQLSGMTLGDCAPGTPAAAAAAETGPLAGLTVGDCAPVADAVRTSQERPVAAGRPSTLLATGQTGGEAGQPTNLEQADATAEHDQTQLELALMGFSTLIALLGIGIATWIWLKRPEIADRAATSLPGLHRLLLNKYYVDEAYDATLVQPIKIVSDEGLWRGMDARVVDGAVNGAGQAVGGMSTVLRLLQSGSVKAYAASTFFGVVAILAYYVWR